MGAANPDEENAMPNSKLVKRTTMTEVYESPEVENDIEDGDEEQDEVEEDVEDEPSHPKRRR
jgi:hypothetical protein